MAIENEKFGKAYKLCYESTIQSLFKTGKKLYKFPFSAQYSFSQVKQITPFQIVISVPKRNFKKATDRNLLKRRIREAIRKNKLILERFLLEEEINLSFVLIYTAKEKMTFKDIAHKTDVFLKELIQDIKNEKKTD